MEVMLVNAKFKTEYRNFIPGEIYIVSGATKTKLTNIFELEAQRLAKPNIVNTVKFIELDGIFKKAVKNGNFKNLLIIRSGGIGDIIALTSIIDFFSDSNIHFVTQKIYFDLFEWFEIKPKLYSFENPFITGYKSTDALTRFSNWARFQAEGVIENGHDRNWMELFFSFINENEPDINFLRPQLKEERINDLPSNIQTFQKKSKSLLICNKATAMMRTCHLTDIVEALPERVLNQYDLFAYKDNLSTEDLKNIDSINKKAKIIVIEKTDLKTFLLDCFDADKVISVDTGALHFREAIGKDAIGLFNSFTADSRTKHYQCTKSYDVKSDCEYMPCFLHETSKTRFCKKGKAGMFAAPCFDSKTNKTLLKQLKDIFEINL
jgi:ADP-heptose:LPS heptosyltransferase